MEGDNLLYLNGESKKGNAQKGVMFTVFAKKDIAIAELWTFFSSTGSTEISIYIRLGGAQKTSKGWTQIISDQSVIVSSTSDMVKVSSNLKIAIKQGERIGVAIISSNINIDYTGGETVYSDTNMSILSGQGFDSLNGSYFNPRIFNGTIGYELATLSPSAPLSISLVQSPYLTQKIVPLTWSPSTSPSGLPITYDVELFNGISWISCGIFISATSLNISIPPGIQTTTAKFRVRARDSNNNASDYTESNVFSISTKLLLLKVGDMIKVIKNGTITNL